MFVYSYRIYDLYRRPAVSLAVLCDDQPGWRPNHFGYNIWDCRLEYHFPALKILDYRDKERELERSPNPFAPVILAQLKVLQTRGSPQTRWQWKVRLIKGLYERGLPKEQIRQLMRVLDWMVTLPPELDESFHEEVHRLEQERRMPYVTTFERIGHEKGLEEGIVKGWQNSILALLKSRFKAAGAKYAAKVRAIDDVARLESLLQAVARAETFDEVRALLR